MTAAAMKTLPPAKDSAMFELRRKAHYHLDLTLEFPENDSHPRPFRNDVTQNIHVFLESLKMSGLISTYEIEMLNTGHSVDSPTIEALVSLKDITLERAALVGLNLRRHLEDIREMNKQWTMVVEVKIDLPRLS